MQITKYGHSCVLIDNGTIKILFDPGIWSNLPALSVDVVIITHVHQDHLDIAQLQKLLAHNPARVITNSEVAAELLKHGIDAEVLEDGAHAQLGSIPVVAYGQQHAMIHSDLPRFKNTGYMLGDAVFHPGDAFTVPSKPVHTLLLPVAAPWSKLSETLDYINVIRPRVCIPIHDGFLKEGGSFYQFAQQWCERIGTQFIEPELQKHMKFNFIIIPLVIFATAYYGSRFTRQGLSGWYQKITKPDWTPSGEIIGMVWTMLYILIAVSVLWFWNIPVVSFWHYIIGVLLIVNAVLNAYWNKIFFVDHDIHKAYREMQLLNATTIIIAGLMLFTSYIAPLLLVPYILWVGFATYLTRHILLLNTKTK